MYFLNSGPFVFDNQSEFLTTASPENTLASKGTYSYFFFFFFGQKRDAHVVCILVGTLGVGPHPSFLLAHRYLLITSDLASYA